MCRLVLADDAPRERMHAGGPQAEAHDEIRGRRADDALLDERVLGHERPLRKPGLGQPHVREMTSFRHMPALALYIGAHFISTV